MKKWAALVMLMPCMAFAADWQLIYSEDADWIGNKSQNDPMNVKEHSSVSEWIDRDSIVVTGHKKSVWWKTTASKDGYEMNTVVKYVFDCKRKTVINTGFGTKMYPNSDYSYLDYGEHDVAHPYKEFEIKIGLMNRIYSVVCLNRKPDSRPQ